MVGVTARECVCERVCWVRWGGGGLARSPTARTHGCCLAHSCGRPVTDRRGRLAPPPESGAPQEAPLVVGAGSEALLPRDPGFSVRRLPFCRTEGVGKTPLGTGWSQMGSSLARRVGGQETAAGSPPGCGEWAPGRQTEAPGHRSGVSVVLPRPP